MLSLQLPRLHQFPDTSGGAIYHTGYLRLSNTSFVANEVGIEGPAIISIGFLEELSSVYFSENAFDCRAGEYGYIVENEVSSVFFPPRKCQTTGQTQSNIRRVDPRLY